MRATGIIRRVDDIGRIVIPKEVRRSLRIRDGDPMELFVEDGGVVFRKYNALEEDIFDTVQKAMKAGGRSYALYDRDIKRESYRDSGYPCNVPDEWFDKSGEFTYLGNAVYTIGRYGDVWGFICTDRTNDDYIRGVVSMVINSLWGDA